MRPSVHFTIQFITFGCTLVKLNLYMPSSKRQQDRNTSPEEDGVSFPPSKPLKQHYPYFSVELKANSETLLAFSALIVHSSSLGRCWDNQQSPSPSSRDPSATLNHLQGLIPPTLSPAKLPISTKLSQGTEVRVNVRDTNSFHGDL